MSGERRVEKREGIVTEMMTGDAREAVRGMFVVSEVSGAIPIAAGGGARRLGGTAGEMKIKDAVDRAMSCFTRYLKYPNFTTSFLYRSEYSGLGNVREIEAKLRLDSCLKRHLKC